LIYSNIESAQKRTIALVLFAIWLAVVSYFSWNHLVWRDEVKALSLAEQGDNVFAMLKGIQGESHPAVWYLLLRAGHALFPHPEVLLIVAVTVAASAMLILLLRAPFSLPFLALILVTRFSIFEYSVMARNYGISMLCMFLFAACYKHYRDRGYVLGAILFLLANCNAHGAMLSGGLLVFWAFDIWDSGKFRVFFYNAAFAALGVMVCFLTIYPTYNDAATIDFSVSLPKRLMYGLFLPSMQFATSMHATNKPWIVVSSLILFGSTLGLTQKRAAFVAALLTLVGFSLFFVVMSPGVYRHEALWLVFMICLYWLAGPTEWTTLSKVGTAVFVVLLLLQLPYTARLPLQRSPTIASILAGHSEAVVVADPDYLIETLPYYVSNPTYFLREQRYGNVAHFNRKSQMQLSLGDLMDNARRIRRDSGKPVVVLLRHPIDPSQETQVYDEGYGWKITITAEQALVFQHSMRLLGHYAGLAQSGEDYDVYAMEDP
jgi:hypothetical protein